MTDREKIIDKIKKCLALSASSNEHEAAAALRQARKLMEAHNISDAEMLAAGATEHHQRAGAKCTPSRWETHLATCIGDAFGCRTIFGTASHPNHISKACPYGQPGDRLWVREAHSIRVLPSVQSPEGLVWYRESDIGRQWGGEVRWKPSIHMPRWASRILLEITGVRVERLQEISEVDALYEGAEKVETQTGFGGYADGYRTLWEQINGPGSWEANPWVWVVEFKRVTP